MEDDDTTASNQEPQLGTESTAWLQSHVSTLNNRGSASITLDLLCSSLRAAVKRQRQKSFSFKLSDTFGSRRVGKKRFLAGCLALQLTVTQQDLNLIWAYLAEGNTEGTVDIDALVAYAKARGPPSKSQLVDKSYLSLRANDRLLLDETTGEQRKERIRAKTEYADKLHTLVCALRRAVKSYEKSYDVTAQKLFSKFRKRRDGLVEMTEVLEGLRVCQLVITNAQMEMLWPLLDVQGRGGIGLINWENFLQKRMQFSYKHCEDKYFSMPHAKELGTITGSWLPGVGGTAPGSSVSKPKSKLGKGRGRKTKSEARREVPKSKTHGWIEEDDNTNAKHMPRWARERVNLYKTEKPYQPIRFSGTYSVQQSRGMVNFNSSVSSVSSTLSSSSSMSSLVETQGGAWGGKVNAYATLSETAKQKEWAKKERETAKKESIRTTTQTMTQLLSREEMGKLHSEEQILAAEKIAGVARVAVGIRMAERIILRQLHLRKLGAMLAQEMSDTLKTQAEKRRVQALTGVDAKNQIEASPSESTGVPTSRYGSVGWGEKKSSSAEDQAESFLDAKDKPSLFGKEYTNRPPVAWRAQSARSGHVLIWHQTSKIPCRLSICQKRKEPGEKKKGNPELCMILKHYGTRTEKKALVHLSPYLEMSFQGLDQYKRRATIYKDVMAGLPCFVSYEKEVLQGGETHAPVHFVSESHLHKFLVDMNVDVSQYGKDNAKTVEQLREEINAGGCRLRIARSTGPAHQTTGIRPVVLRVERVLTAVNVALRSKCAPHLVLFETARTMPNGITSDRKGHKCIPSKKLSPEQLEMPKNKAVEQCAMEILQEQLKLGTSCVRIVKGTMNTSMLVRNSNAFPGISTKYCIYRVDAQLEDSDLKALEVKMRNEDGTTEGNERITGLISHTAFDTRVCSRLK
jgi:hypothetical protein